MGMFSHLRVFVDFEGMPTDKRNHLFQTKSLPIGTGESEHWIISTGTLLLDEGKEVGEEWCANLVPARDYTGCIEFYNESGYWKAIYLDGKLMGIREG